MACKTLLTKPMSNVRGQIWRRWGMQHIQGVCTYLPCTLRFWQVICFSTHLPYSQVMQFVYSCLPLFKYFLTAPIVTSAGALVQPIKPTLILLLSSLVCKQLTPEAEEKSFFLTTWLFYQWTVQQKRNNNCLLQSCHKHPHFTTFFPCEQFVIEQVNKQWCCYC